MEELLKKVVLKKIISATLQRLFLRIPFLGFGPIGFVITFFVTKIAEKAFEELQTIIKLKHVDIKNEKLRRSFDLESVKLEVFAKQFGEDSKEYKEVHDESKKSLSKFISFN